MVETAQLPAVQKALINKLVAELIPYSNNARTHSDEQVAKLAASIKEFGFNNPVLIDEQNGIVAGHGRVMAARKLGLLTVPCLVLDHLSDAQRRAYVLADNRLALDASWDQQLLGIEIERLMTDGFDLSLTGFDPEEINAGDDEPEDEAEAATPKERAVCPKCGYDLDEGK